MDTLDELRHAIADLDLALLKLLSRRQAIISMIASQKKTLSCPIFDSDQEQKQHEQYQNWANELALSPLWVEKFFQVIIAYSKETQKTIRAE